MKFLEHAHIVHAAPAALIAANEDIWNGDVATDVISMANAKSCVFMIIQNAGTGSASVQIFACSTVTPTATAAISFSYKRITAGDTHGATTETKLLRTTGGATGSNCIYVIEVDAAKLAEHGYKYVQLDATEASNFPVDGAIVAFLMGLRSAEDALGTQLT